MFGRASRILLYQILLAQTKNLLAREKTDKQGNGVEKFQRPVRASKVTNLKFLLAPESNFYRASESIEPYLP